MALYAAHLASGSTLVCRSIKADSIKAYLTDVGKFIAQGHGPDPRYAEGDSTRLAPQLHTVYDEVKRWESQKNRREPFTTKMWQHVAKLAADEPSTSVNSALRDWFGLGLHAGLRLGEWAQIPSKGDLSSTPGLNMFGDATAFCLADVEFFSSYKRRLSLHEAIRLPHGSVQRASIRFRTQKNGDNGRKITFCTGSSGQINSVECLLNIVRRFVHLTGTWALDTPIAIFRTSGGHVRRITSNEIESCMRLAACAAYGFHPVNNAAELQKWSAHSLRVGACVILYTLGFTDVQIQHLLRWKSLAFMEYLRNLGAMAIRQSQAIADISNFPNYL